jgi:branched-subunit amino acid aminotransferase/4-amino-4-deoxychorismate lyase
MCNSVRGIQPVIRLGEQQWPVGELTRRLQLALQES